MDSARMKERDIMTHKPHAMLLLITLVILLTTPAMATPIIFTDRTAFDAAVGGTTLITDFPSVDSGPVPGTCCGCCLVGTVDGVLRLGPSDVNAWAGVGGPSLVFNGESGGISATTLHPVTAIGFDMTPLPSFSGNLPTPYSELFSTGGHFIFTQPQFLGFLFPQPTIFSMSGTLFSAFAIDNMAIKTVPEPPSWLLLACGLAVLAGWRSRKVAP
jgi:hypothetical protein